MGAEYTPVFLLLIVAFAIGAGRSEERRVGKECLE